MTLMLYSYDVTVSGTAEWTRNHEAEAPTVTLRMQPGAAARFRTGLRGRFTLEADVAADPGDGEPCTFTVRSADGAWLPARSIVRRPGDPPLGISVRGVAAGRLELVLGVEGGTGGSWGCPRLRTGASLGTLAHAAAARIRRQWQRRGALGVVTDVARSVHRTVRGVVGDRYTRWLMRQERDAPLLDRVRREIEALRSTPLFSVVILSSGAPSDQLERCVLSIREQSYRHWELVQARGLLDALRTAKGAYVLVLEGGGIVARDALYEIARTLDERGALDLVYTDEDQIDGARRSDPFFKPDWSPEYCLSRLYVGQLAVYRRELLQGLDDLRDGEGAVQDLLLRVIERASRIHHVPKVLWHAFDHRPVDARAALSAHLTRTGLDASVVPGPLAGCYRVRRRIRGAPRVGIVILTRDRVHLLRRCLESIARNANGIPYEITIVDNGSVEEDTRRFLAACGHRVVRDPAPFNFARLNNVGARHTAGDHLLFLNNDVEVIDEDALAAMVELAQEETIGAVGAKLYYPDGRLQHVGMVLGPKDGVAQVFRGSPGGHPGYFHGAVVAREYSAVTGACLMTRREVFERMNGFDEAFVVEYSDVDYCLRVRRSGYRVVFTPHARLWHHEFATRPRRAPAAERARFRQRWSEEIACDPYFNPNLSREHVDCQPAL